MSPTTLENYRQKLLALKTQLRADVDVLIGTALAPAGGGGRMPIHMAELGSAASATDANLRLSLVEQKTLRQIEAALARIEAGTFGICTATGRRIPRSRLDAVPYAEHCIEHARALEQGLTAN